MLTSELKKNNYSEKIVFLKRTTKTKNWLLIVDDFILFLITVIEK